VGVGLVAGPEDRAGAGRGLGEDGAVSDTPLSPTARTRITRLGERGGSDRAELLEFLGGQFVGHLGVLAGDPAAPHPTVLPVAYAVDPGGPDRDGTVYVHGSVGAGWMRGAAGRPACLTVTALDGLVLARSAFHHSMNYRCAVVIGAARAVEDAEERSHALRLVVEQIVPGRSATLRANSRKELAATAVLALPLHEASFKSRTGEAGDEPEDVAAGVWAGVLPLRLATTGVVANSDAHGAVPADVEARAGDFA
jgi:nitroimidazol reductase NimA-like FMN-containing flavoprotein (pyridoxamine 5'-phosphate oxidase superfamily)